MQHGVPIIVSEHALEETKERLFPESRHRSRRIRKKLLRRFGGEFRMKPAIWQTQEGLVMHPTHYRALRARMKGHGGADPG